MMRGEGGRPDRPLKFPGLTRRPWWRRIKWHYVLSVAAAVIAVGSGAVWLARDTMGLLRPSGPAEGSLRVNVNIATVEELATIPGVAETRALQIIANRPYDSVDELTRVPGIAESNLRQFLPFVKVEGEHERIRR